MIPVALKLSSLFAPAPTVSKLQNVYCQPVACRPYIGGSTFHEHQLQLLVLLNMSAWPPLSNEVSFVTVIWSSSMSNLGLHFWWAVGLPAPDMPPQPSAAAGQTTRPCHLQSSTVSALGTCPVSFCSSLGRPEAASARSISFSPDLQCLKIQSGLKLQEAACPWTNAGKPSVDQAHRECCSVDVL